MNSKYLFGSCILSLACCSLLQTANAQKATSKKKPNVLFVLMDDIGPGWLPPYARQLKESDLELDPLNEFKRTRGKNGYSTEKQFDAARHSMPFVDQLSSKGVVFNMCFTSANLCAPSRSGIMSASYQQRYGCYDNVDVEETGIPQNYPFLSKEIKKEGYNTAMIGKWHVGSHDETLKVRGGEKKKDDMVNGLGYESSCAPGQSPLEQGFDYYFGYNNHGSRYYEADDLWEGYVRVPKRPEGEFLTDLFSDKVADFVDQSLQKDKPFFVYYAPKTIHGRIDPPPMQYQSKFDTGIESTNVYAGHLLALDEGIRKIYAVLQKYGQQDNTLFIIASDNGAPNINPPYNAPFKGGKGTAWLGGSHCPLIVVLPGQTQPLILNDLVSTIDIMPTVLDFIGIKVPEKTDGRSLKPLVTGKTNKGPHDMIFASGLHSTRWTYSKTGKAKNQESNVCPLYAWGLNNEEVMLYITPTKAGLYEDYPDGLPARKQLSNWKNDPQQMEDLLVKNPEKETSAKKQINNWLKQLSEPVMNHQNHYKELIEQTR